MNGTCRSWAGSFTVFVSTCFDGDLMCGISDNYFLPVLQEARPVPTGLTNLLETFVVFVKDEIAIPSLGEYEGERLTPYYARYSFLFWVLI